MVLTMRQLKSTLEQHPAFLLLTLITATLALLFVFIDLNDRMKWDIL